MEESFAAVIDQRIQWIFAKRTTTGSGQLLSIVISGANAFADTSKGDLVQDALRELSSLLPGISQAQLLHSVVLKEKRATFVPRPGLESVRPSATTAIPNLVLAGDWTNTGYPATIEGALVSGVKASACVGE
jgi:uncharacterized protein with NAD-binding domain and iron-sulfur cluster